MITPLILLTLLFAAALLIIHAQSYDDGGLNVTLFAANCQPPCFMGIHPGVTTRDQAIQLLKANPWVTLIQPIYGDQGITWAWTGVQPAFLRVSGNSSEILFKNGIVDHLNISSAATLATFLITYGAPDALYYRGDLATTPLSNLVIISYFSQYAVYTRWQFEVSMEDECPLSASQQWTLPVGLDMPVSPIDYTNYARRSSFIPLPEDCR